MHRLAHLAVALELNGKGLAALLGVTPGYVSLLVNQKRDASAVVLRVLDLFEMMIRGEQRSAVGFRIEFLGRDHQYEGYMDATGVGWPLAYYREKMWRWPLERLSHEPPPPEPGFLSVPLHP